MSNYKELRDKAFNGTPRGLSFEILSSNSHLVFHPPINPDGKKAHYTIYQENSAICCTAEEAMLLYKITLHKQPDLFVEIGSYAGWSSAHILVAMAYNSYFAAVDNFSECNNPELVKQVLSNQLCNYPNSFIHEQDSTEFLRSLQVSPDIIFIDGFHRDGKPLEDVKAAIKVIADDGLVILHDTWMKNVKEAHEYLVEKGFYHHTFKTDNYLTVYSEEDLSWLETLV